MDRLEIVSFVIFVVIFVDVVARLDVLPLCCCYFSEMTVFG